MATQLEDTYDVSGAEVFLSVTVGDGQFGSSRIIVDGNKSYTGQNIIRYSLGEGGTLTNKLVRVVTVVTDTNPSTNKMDVTHVLEGGPNVRTFPLSTEVESEGDSVIFDAKFHFRKV